MSDPTSESKDVQKEEQQAFSGASSEAAPHLSPQALMDLVSQGQRTLGQGRAAEALRIADAILEDQPDSVSALALKGDALERLGQFEEALVSYERVLELKPDSALDRIRATQLKRQLEEAPVAATEAPSHRKALLAGLAGAAFVLSVGIPIFLLNQGKQPSKDAQTLASNQSGYVAENFPSVAPVPTTPEAASGQVRSSVPPPAADQQTRTTADPAARSSVVEPGYTGGAGSTRIPGGSPSPGGVEPVNPVPNGMREGIAVVPSNLGGRTDSQPQPNGSNGQADSPEPIRQNTETKTEDPGIIDIRPSASSGSSGRTNNAGSKEAEDDEAAKQSSETLVRVARDAFVRGDYSRAADAYEKALRQGASRGSTNQRLAQCYERMGRKADAISAYERAIAAYQSTLSSGSGDSSRVQAALDTCRQALKVLRG